MDLGRLYTHTKRREFAETVWTRLESIYPDDVRFQEQIVSRFMEERESYRNLQPTMPLKLTTEQLQIIREAIDEFSQTDDTTGSCTMASGYVAEAELSQRGSERDNFLAKVAAKTATPQDAARAMILHAELKRHVATRGTGNSTPSITCRQESCHFA